jgi:hypothetical protein
MSDENNLQQDMPRPVRTKYPRLNPEQKKEVAKPIDHRNLCSKIQQDHKKTQIHVRDKFTQDAKPVWVDKG